MVNFGKNLEFWQCQVSLSTFLVRFCQKINFGAWVWVFFLEFLNSWVFSHKPEPPAHTSFFQWPFQITRGTTNVRKTIISDIFRISRYPVIWIKSCQNWLSRPTDTGRMWKILDIFALYRSLFDEIEHLPLQVGLTMSPKIVGIKMIKNLVAKYTYILQS